MSKSILNCKVIRVLDLTVCFCSEGRFLFNSVNH